MAAKMDTMSNSAVMSLPSCSVAPEGACVAIAGRDK
jgi:hypothetical protein